MYSQKESIIKGHYTVTLSMSPITNVGYMFEVHKDNIFVIESATFDDKLQYEQIILHFHRRIIRKRKLYVAFKRDF
ncbi:MAG: hypothetical protein OQK45_07695 [Sulfurovum sp.]|nr:hypothetical protein [Sulfurovum sp.]